MKTVLLLLLVVSGCASVAVTSASLEQRTAASTGMAVGSFQIERRVDDGVRTDYVARGNDGRVFNCYVTGTVSYTGRSVSDAMCNQVGGKAAGATNKPVSSEDNALVHEYKKTQKK